MKIETLKIDDVEYVRKDSIKPQITDTGAVMIVDCGRIFAGDIIWDNGRIKGKLGLDGVLKNQSPDKAIIKLTVDFDLPASSEIIRFSVCNERGLK